MLSIYTVCFFGHRRIETPRNADERVYKLVCRLLKEHEYVDFLVGRDGEFDQIVSSCIIRAKRNVFSENCSHIWVLPYSKAEYLNDRESYEAYYDSIELCEASSSAYPKAAIQIRNREMVDRSDLCVFYIENSFGGAFQTMKYAEKQGKRLINLAKVDD